jgi:hypothetical protein
MLKGSWGNAEKSVWARQIIGKIGGGRGVGVARDGAGRGTPGPRGASAGRAAGDPAPGFYNPELHNLGLHNLRLHNLCAK